jgi:hypothetical protein
VCWWCRPAKRPRDSRGRGGRGYRLRHGAPGVFGGPLAISDGWSRALGSHLVLRDGRSSRALSSFSGWRLLPPTPSEADSPMPTPAAHPLGGRFSDANSCRPPLRRWFRGCQLAPPTSETAASGFSVYRRPSPRPARYGCRIRLSTSSEAGTAERTSMTLASTSGDSAAALRASGFLRDSQESGVTILERCSRTAPVAVLRPGFPGFLVWLAVASASASSGRPSRFSSIAREAWLHEAMVGMQDYKSKEEGRDP